MQQQVSIAPDGVYDDGALYLAPGLSPATLSKARRSGQLRFTRKGKRTLYLGRWVLDWIEAGDTTPCAIGGDGDGACAEQEARRDLKARGVNVCFASELAGKKGVNRDE